MANPPEDNGILARIRGEDISAAGRQLPRADLGQPSPQTAEIDTPNAGRVRITYRLASHKRGKATSWFWVACNAVQVV